MDSAVIHLHGNQRVITETPGKAYRILSGNLLVFILPLKEEKEGRRWLFCELKQGDTVPTLFYEAEDINGMLCKWVFSLTALDSCELEVVEDSEEIRRKFARKAKRKDYVHIGFEESIIESYRLESVREQRNIFAAGEERKAIFSRGLETIYRVFHSGKVMWWQLHEPTGDVLYDACARLCDWQGIKPISLESLRSNCGRRYTVKDLARVSGFICRDIQLEKNWFRQDAGPLLAFRSKNRQPVVCFPKKIGQYQMWDPKTGHLEMVTEDVAAELDTGAMMFYRSFPHEKITLKKLLLFGVHDIYWRDLISILLFTLVGTLVGLLTPYLNEKMLDLYIPLGDISGLRGVCAVVLACAIGNVTFTVVKNLASFRFINRMKYSVQAAVFDRVFNMPVSSMRDYHSAGLGTQAMNISKVFSLLTSTVLNAFITAVFSIAYLWRMFDYSSTLSWISIWMMAAVLLVILILERKKIKCEREQIQVSGQVSMRMFQYLNGISKIRVSGAENRALYEYMRYYTECRKLDIRKEKYDLGVTILSGSIGTVFSMVFYYFIVHQRVELSVGSFVGFTTAFGSFSAAIIGLAVAFQRAVKIIPLSERVEALLEVLPEKQEESMMPVNLTGEIEISNVSFAYKEGMPYAIRDLSLHISPGEYIGIVGPSGCGKSTLLNLLLGFEKPSSGKIFYDGRDIDTFDKRELRKRFGVVLQHGGLITGSINENITITNPSATLKQVQRAVREAGLEEDIANMPMGLHTVLSEGDGSISGGQKQRILIARAIVGNPKFLFFDEATSELDNTAQAAVSQNLDKLKATRIVIAHRLSTIIHCDRILVMNEGQIVEEGNYEQLMEKKGLFYRLASRQIL